MVHGCNEATPDLRLQYKSNRNTVNGLHNRLCRSPQSLGSQQVVTDENGKKARTLRSLTQLTQSTALLQGGDDQSPTERWAIVSVCHPSDRSCNVVGELQGDSEWPWHWSEKMKREERKETSTHETMRMATRIVMPSTQFTGGSPLGWGDQSPRRGRATEWWVTVSVVVHSAWPEVRSCGWVAGG